MIKKCKLFFNENGKNLVLSIIKLAVGVMLLIDPITLTSWVIRIFGVIAALTGIMNIIRYFTHAPAVAAREYRFVRGLVAILAGLFCILYPDWFKSAFPILARIYCIGALLAGLLQLQWMADMIRLHKKDWQLQGLNALLSLILSAVIFWNPFYMMEALWLFISIALIAMAAPEILMMIHRLKKSDDLKEAPVKSAEEPSVEPIQESQISSQNSESTETVPADEQEVDS